MTYSPQFDRNSDGFFDKENNFIRVRAGTDAYLTEDELNEMQAIQLEWLRSLSRIAFTSGITSDIAGVSVVTSGDARYLKFGSFTALVDGLPVFVAHCNLDNQLGTNSVKLGDKPASGSRTDVVFLEVVEVEVKVGDTLYRYGNTNGVPCNNSILDSRIGAETTRRIQIQSTIRQEIGSHHPGTSSQGNPYVFDNETGYYKAGPKTFGIPLFLVTQNSTGDAPTWEVAYRLASVSLAPAKWNGRATYMQYPAPAIGAGKAGMGDEWVDTSTGRWHYCDGTKWIDPLKLQD